jgi:hypothetical protein
MHGRRYGPASGGRVKRLADGRCGLYQLQNELLQNRSDHSRQNSRNQSFEDYSYNKAQHNASSAAALVSVQPRNLAFVCLLLMLLLLTLR